MDFSFSPATGDVTWDFLTILSNSSPALIFVVIIISLVRGWLLLPSAIEASNKRIDDRDKQLLALQKDRDEFKEIALKAISVGERVTSVVEGRGGQ